MIDMTTITYSMPFRNIIERYMNGTTTTSTYLNMLYGRRSKITPISPKIECWNDILKGDENVS